MPTKKLYLPPWILWVFLPILILVWGMATFSTFGRPLGQEPLGMLEWGLVSLFILAMGVVVWLMGTGHLPAYIMVEEDSDTG